MRRCLRQLGDAALLARLGAVRSYRAVLWGGTRFAVLMLWFCLTAHVALLHRRLTEKSPLCGGWCCNSGTTRSGALLFLRWGVVKMRSVFFYDGAVDTIKRISETLFFALPSTGLKSGVIHEALPPATWRCCTFGTTRSGALLSGCSVGRHALRGAYAMVLFVRPCRFAP